MYDEKEAIVFKESASRTNNLHVLIKTEEEKIDWMKSCSYIPSSSCLPAAFINFVVEMKHLKEYNNRDFVWMKRLQECACDEGESHKKGTFRKEVVEKGEDNIVMQNTFIRTDNNSDDQCRDRTSNPKLSIIYDIGRSMAKIDSSAGRPDSSEQKEVEKSDKRNNNLKVKSYSELCPSHSLVKTVCEEDNDIRKKERSPNNGPLMPNVKLNYIKEDISNRKENFCQSAPSVTCTRQNCVGDEKTSDDITSQEDAGPDAESTEQFKRGDLVWAKMSTYPWWPGVVIEHSDVGLDQTPQGYIQILWFGDHRMTAVKTTSVFNFAKFQEKLDTKKRTVSYLKAVNEGINEVAKRTNNSSVVNLMSMNEKIEWMRHQSSVPSSNELPEFLAKDMARIKRWQEHLAMEGYESDEEKLETDKGFFSDLTSIPVCLAQRPKNCRLCDCELPQDYLLGRENLCGKCELQEIHDLIIKYQISPESPLKKQRIRVLSLFDGIGSGLLALKNLGFDVEAYYTSEIDKNAIDVVNKNFPGQVHNMGDITEITKKQLNEILPIDLVIGGSPCNDLSLVNPNRKGPYGGTGLLFFEFHRILYHLKSDDCGSPSSGKHKMMYWVFENVVSMPKDFRIVLNRFMSCDPVIIDSAEFTAQRRKRSYWGNIPLLGKRPLPRYSPVLQDYLEPPKRAKFKKVGTITSNSNSLRQGRDKTAAVVLENGENINLCITEVEKLFGFPQDYTDVGSLSPTKRLALVGKSWSVPVIEHILAPLKLYFKTR